MIWGSTASVEFVLRLEQRFGVHLREGALGSVETVADLVALVNSAASEATPHLTVAASVRLMPCAPITAPHTAKTLNEVLAWDAERHPDARAAIPLDCSAHSCSKFLADGTTNGGEGIAHRCFGYVRFAGGMLPSRLLRQIGQRNHADQGSLIVHDR